MIEFSKYNLQNGLTVIHHLDETTPFVVVNTLYKVGAMHENESKTGFAHLFEHLMFGGSKNVKHFDQPLQEAGGENNAFTNNDFTNYYNVVPFYNIEIPLFLEADRMENLNINNKTLDVQRKVVCEEFKENYINQPYGNAWHILREMVYEKHPYKWPTIGKELKHVEDATLEEVQAFYDKYYTPNNAVLVIAGNINLDNTKKLVEKYFGNISSTQQNTVLFDEPIQTNAKHKTVYENVPLNSLYIAFKMSDRINNDYYIADILSDILSGGTSSRLHQKLVKELKIFVEIDAYISGSNDIGMFVVEGKLCDGIDIENANNLVWNELIKLHENLVDDNELTKVKNKMITYMNFSDGSVLNRAINLAHYELLNDIDRINKEEAYYDAVLPTDIQQFATKTFLKEKSNTLFYMKKEK